MAMNVPDPYGVDVAISPTKEMGLVEANNNRHSELNALSTLDQSTKDLADMTQKWQDEQDSTRAKDLINQIHGNREDLTNNPESGYKTLKGINALQQPNGQTLQDNVLGKYDEFVSGLLVNENSNVKRLVKQYSDADRNSLLNAINVHVIDQGDVYRKSVDERSLDIAMSRALSDDPTESHDGEVAVKWFVDQKAAQDGVEPDYTKTLGKVSMERFLREIDNGNLAGASQILNSENHFSSTDRARAKRMLRNAKKHTAQTLSENVLAEVCEDIYSPKTMALVSVEEATGQKFNDADYETALALADNDEKMAVQILAYGIDEFEKVFDGDIDANEEDLLRQNSNAARALSKYEVKSGSEPSADYISTEIVKRVPGIPEASAGRIAKKYLAQRRNALLSQQADRDQKANVAYGSLRSNNPYQSLPESITSGLQKKTITALRDFSDRKQAGSLVTNPGVYWTLIADEDKLKKISDEDLIAYAGELSEQDFDKIWQYRDGLKTGKYKDVKGARTRRVIQDEMKRLGIGGNGANQKEINGFILESVENRVLQDVALAGKDLTNEEVVNITRQVISTTFSINENWGGLNTKTVADVQKKGHFSIDSDITSVIDAGIKATGILDPSDTYRSRVLLSIGLMPNKPIEGANEMVQQIDKVDPQFRKRLIAAYKRKHGGAVPDDTFIVRGYFKNKALFNKAN